MRERKRPAWWIAAFAMSLLLLYALSPPFLVMILGTQNYVDNFAWIYWPLVELSHSSQFIRNWYGWYFELFSSEYWYAWYLGSDPYGGAGGFGTVRDIRPL